MGVITTESSPRRCRTSADRDAGCCIFMEFVVYIIPKTTGFGFSKQWVSFHETTRIFFEGFSHPSFWVPGSESAPGSETALLFVSLLFFSLVLVAFSLVSPLFCG